MSLISTISASSQKGFQSPEPGNGPVLQVKLTAPTPRADGNFGSSIDITDNGDRLIVGEPGGGGTAGYVYFFIRSGSSWTLEDTLTDSVINGSFGINVSISGDGNYATVSQGTGHKTFAYNRSGSSWNLMTTFTSGATAKLNQDGTYCVVGNSNYSRAGSSANGRVLIYNRVTTTWSLQQELTYATGYADMKMGSSVDIDDTGSKIIVGNRPTTVGEAPLSSTRTGSTWSSLFELDFPVLTSETQPVSISGDGNYMSASYRLGSNLQTTVWYPGSTIQIQPLGSNLPLSASLPHVNLNETGDIILVGNQSWNRVSATWSLDVTYTTYEINSFTGLPWIFNTNAINDNGDYKVFNTREPNNGAGAVYIFAS